MKMETTRFSETSVDFQRTTRRYIPEDRTLHDRRCGNLELYTLQLINVYTNGINKKCKKNVRV
jgi:hypothetical protein